MEKAKILIVEDESIIALDIKHSLEYLEYEVIGVVSSANEVLKVVEENLPDLILMDIDLKSSIDGVEITEKLKEIYDVPIVFLTAYSDEKTFQRAKLTEPFGYILKPFDERELYTTIEMALYKHQAERKIKDNEKWLSTILKNIGDAVIACDTNEKIVFINDLGAELTGWEIEEAIGKSIEEVFNILNEKTRKKIEHPVSDLLNEDKKNPSDNIFILLSKKDKEIPIENSVSSIKDEKRKITGYVLVFRDISERKKAERELLESEEKYRATFENTGTVTILFEEEGTVSLINSEFTKIIGYTKEEVEGKMKWMDFIHEDDLHKMISYNKLRPKKPESVPSKYEFRCKDRWGNIRNMINTVTMLPGTNKGIAAALDITELKSTGRKLNILSYAIEQNPVSILIFDVEGKIEYVNSKFLQVTGYAAHDLLEKNVVLSKFVNADENEVKGVWEKIKVGEAWKGEIHQVINENQERWELVSISPIRDPEGNIEHFLLMKEDITELKCSEKALRESVQKYRTIFQNTETGMIITNRENVILLTNDEFVRLSGYSKEDIEGKKNWTEFIFAEDRPKIIDYQKQRIVESDDILNQFDFRLISNSGDIYFTVASIAFIPDTCESVIAILDITERKRTELALKESEELFRLMTNTTKDALYRLKYSDLTYDYVSPAFEELTGYTRDEINKIGFTSIVEEFDVLSKDSISSWDFKPDFDKKSEEYLADILIKTKSGEMRWLGDHSYIWRDENNQIIGTVGILTDMTERKRIALELIQAKEAAERADRLKSDFLAQMSHEIRSPLNTILSFTSLIREEFTGKIPGDLSSIFEIIDTGGRRLTRTIEMILNMSQLQTGNYEVSFRNNDIYKDIILPLYKEFSTLAKTKNIEFNLIKETEDLIFSGDPYTICQLFQNLIDNALKYTKEGIVEIRIFNASDTRIGVSVEDTGIGISEEYLPKLFEPFTQEETGYTRKFEGNGLGLALVKKYADINNLKIDIKSKKGEGTMFTVYFPKS